MKLSKLFDFIMRKVILPENITCCFCGFDLTEPEHIGICDDCYNKYIFDINGMQRPVMPPVDERYAIFKHDKASSAGAIYRMKYNNEPGIAQCLTSLVPKQLYSEYDVLVPVPMHPKKLKVRGYNQAERIASIMSSQSGVPYSTELLVKVKHTKSQTKLKASKRQANVHGAFSASPKCKGLKIALIDDVYTTGSTTSECASALKKSGADFVCVITLAER